MVMVALLLGGCPRDTPGDPGDAATDGGGADADGQVSPGDGGPDAADAGGIQYDFCDEPMFRLPVQEPDRFGGISLWGDRVAFSRYINYPTGPPAQLYLLEITSCVEHQLTDGLRVDEVNLWDRNVYWSDDLTCGSQPCRDVYYMNLDDGNEVELSGDPLGALEPKGNDRFVAYTRYPSENSSWELVLMDIETRQRQVIAPQGSSPTYPVMGERYVVWSGYTADPQSVGKDVFYHDLQTGQTVHVDETYAGYQYGVAVGGEYLTWFGADVDVTAPYHLMLYHIPTGDSTVLVEDDGVVGWGFVHRNLVGNATNRYQGQWNNQQFDVELYDIESGLRRRVTTQPGRISIKGISFPYLLMIDLVEGAGGNTVAVSPHYIVNMVKMGLTDASGRLLPGDGVLAPP
jgi:hypothetical protein